MVFTIFTITDIKYWQKIQNKKNKTKTKQKQTKTEKQQNKQIEKKPPTTSAPTELFLEILFYWHCVTSTTFEYSSR